MDIKNLKKSSVATAYDNIKKYTLLEWLKQLAKELGEKQIKLTKENEGEGIVLTFKEDGTLDKISVSSSVLQVEWDKILHKPTTLVYTDKVNEFNKTNIFLKQTDVRNDTGLTIITPSHDTSTPKSKASFWGDRFYTGADDGPYALFYYPKNKTGTLALLEDIDEKLKQYIKVNEDNPTATANTITIDGIVYRIIGSGEISREEFDALKGRVTQTENINKIQDDAIYDNTAEINKLVRTTEDHTKRLDEIDRSIINLDSVKQNKSDVNLSTTDKTIVGAINEVNAKAEGGENAYVISTANGKNPNFVNDAYDITATQIELQDGTIIPIASLKTGVSIYVLEEAVSDRWYSGNGHFIKLSGDKPILDDYQRKDSLDADVGALGYLKEIYFANIKGSVNDNVALQNEFIKKQDKQTLDTDVGQLGYIKGITNSDIEEHVEGSDFISFNTNPQTEKKQIAFDFTNLNKFIDFPQAQDEVVLSWTADEKPKLSASLYVGVRNKIDNSLQLPKTHTEETIVGVGTNGAQKQLTYKEIFDIFNPVGTIKIFDKATDMSQYSNGTWELIEDNTFIGSKGITEGGQYGGSNDAIVVSHTHTIDNSGNHSHSAQVASAPHRHALLTTDGYANTCNGLLRDADDKWIGGNNKGTSSTSYIYKGGSSQDKSYLMGTGDDTAHTHTISGSGTHTHTINSSGNDGTNKNMPKYLASYIYRRTA